MMMHEKLMADRSGHFQPSSASMATLDIYSAYAYQQQLQQQLLNSHMTMANTAQLPQNAVEVLDLSRRESVDLPRKTPSPYHTNSSLESGSPAGSPNSLIHQQPKLLSSNLLYAAQAHQQVAQNVNNLNLPGNLAALYPGLYYPAAVKQEPMSTTPPPSTATVPMSQPAPAINSNNLLQTCSAFNNEVPEPQSPPPASLSITNTSPTTNTLSSLDAKNTRPFKAFPRDPLVIAANFAATDVLLDNSRAERYTTYRKRILEQIRSNNGGSRTVTNPKMRRTTSLSGNAHEGSSSNNSENDDRHHDESSDCDSNSGQDSQTAADSKTNESAHNTSINNSSNSGSVVKDAAYYERRRKNNAAAKKSRDRRRIKEDEIAIRAAYLERQNIELLCQIDALKAQLAAMTSKSR